MAKHLDLELARTAYVLLHDVLCVKKGESVTLTPVVNEGANPGGFKWKSSNKKVATVKNGVVKFKKKGKVTITCTSAAATSFAFTVWRSPSMEQPAAAG